jgi:hypothetical protein
VNGVPDEATDDVSDHGPGLAELLNELKRLRLAAGQPSLRSIAQKTGWSRATVGRIFNGEVPKWDSLDAVVSYLGGDAERFRQLWAQAMQEASPLTANTPARDPGHRQLSPYLAGICLTLLFVIVSAQGVAPAAAARNQAITDVAQLGFGTLATALWAVVARRRRTAVPVALALGLAGWSAGQGYWLTMRDVLDTPIPNAPSIGDWLYLVFPLCVIAGFTVELPPKLRWAWAAMLSALMVSTSIAVILALWVAIRRPIGAAAIYALYVVSDLAVVGIFSWRVHRERGWTSATALAGVTVLLVSDVLFVYFAWWRPQTSIPYGADIGYMIFPLAMSVAASYALEKR